MKFILTVIFILAFSFGYSQDSLKTKQIDDLVTGMNTANFAATQDSIVKDFPQLGLKMTTYLTSIVKDGELIKYVNFVNSSKKEIDGVHHMVASNAFYFDKNKLIKVEEYLIEGDKKNVADWYYSDDKPIYYTLQSEKAEQRAIFLLSLSKDLVKKLSK